MSASDQNQNPIFGEILASDLLYGFNYADLNIVGLSTLDPSALWSQIKVDPWLAMAVFDDMEEKDDVIASSFDQRKDAVIAKSRRVLPASDKLRDRKIAEFIQDVLDGDFVKSGELYSGLNHILYETLDAVGKGVAIGEIVYKDGGDRVTIEDVKFKPQGLFTFNSGELASSGSNFGAQDGPLRLRNWTGIKGVGEDGILPPNNFLVASYRPKHGNRWGRPTDRLVYWPSFFRRSGMRVFLRYLEKGQGTVIARYNDSGSKAERALALEAAMAVAEEVAVALAAKFNVKVEENVRQSLGSAHKELVDEICANAIMRVILGQTLTGRGGEGGGGWSKGDVHQQVRAEKIEADAKFLMYVINEYMVKPIVLFNFGPSVPLPLWVIKYKPQSDQSADSIVHTRLAGAGLKIPTKYIYENYQIPEPSPDEDVLEAPQQAAGLPTTGVDAAADFAEKKTSASGKTLNSKPGSKIARFSRLRHYTIKSSSE